ncbi:hypothetical protein [uncultured Alcanivorax sp.]|jgi:hypothetical protein|uniref:hypothetical protein n=1 Tax=uncultured Alcanivorax sp. TaxID=191215 RepID=UPI00258CB5C0|nr:hypothetical protein [uncultured Alcanivorax sp.]
MKYSPGQLRKAVGLNPEAYRHWKTVLPSLSTFNGHSAKFLIGDILAIALLKRLTDICSIKIGNLSGISEALFDLCNSVSLDELESLTLLIDLKNNTCSTARLLDRQISADVLIAVPLAAVIAELRADIMEMQNEDAQGQLILAVPSSSADHSVVSESR